MSHMEQNKKRIELRENRASCRNVVAVGVDRWSFVVRVRGKKLKHRNECDVSYYVAVSRKKVCGCLSLELANDRRKISNQCNQHFLFHPADPQGVPGFPT